MYVSPFRTNMDKPNMGAISYPTKHKIQESSMVDSTIKCGMSTNSNKKLCRVKTTETSLELPLWPLGFKSPLHTLNLLNFLPQSVLPVCTTKQQTNPSETCSGLL